MLAEVLNFQGAKPILGMGSLSILVLEDDALQARTIQTILSQQYKFFSYTFCHTYMEAFHAVQTQTFDLFILDVCLSDEPDNCDGIRFAQILREMNHYSTTPILFLTAYPEYMQTCINTLHCYAYLTKPYSDTDLLHTFDDILIAHTHSEIKDFTAVKMTNGILTYIKISDILFIEANGHICHIQCNGCNGIETRTPLHVLSKQLPDYFFQCHKKYIINILNIQYYDKSCHCIHFMQDRIPVGRAYKTAFEEKSRFYLVS